MRATNTVADGPLRVVVVGLNYYPETTGIAPYTTALTRHLAAARHDVTVITGHPHYPEWRLHDGFATPRPAEQNAGVRVIRVAHPVPRRPTVTSRTWMEAVFACKAMRHLLRLRPHVVVSVSPALLSLIPAVVLKPFGYRVGAIVQDLYGAAVAETGVGGRVFADATERLERLLLRQAHGIAVIHQVFASRLTAAGIPAERIEVIPNWTHVTMPPSLDRDATRRELGWERDEFIALHAGNMGVKQGLEGLVDAARLAEKTGSFVRVVLLGDGARRNAIRQYGTGATQLTFMDPLPSGRFEAAVAAADCLLLHEKPGVVEMSVPSKLTTYFAAGRPVVAATSPMSGAASLMTASGAGEIVPPGDANAILAAIESLASNSELAERYGASGRAYAAENLGEATSLRLSEAWIRAIAGPIVAS